MAGAGAIGLTRLNYYWRLFATGLSFAVFGIGGIILALTLLPFVWLVKRDPVERTRFGKRCVQLSFRLFIELMRVLGVLRYRMNNFQALRDRSGMLVVANHPSLIDVIFLVAFIDNADCVVKAALKHNPATFGPITAAGYLVNKGGEQLMDACADSLARGNNLIIFPEGTRTVPGQPLAMQRGAANIALKANVPFTPVCISCEPTTLTKAEKWYQIPPRRFTMELTVMDDIDLATAMGDSPNKTLASRKLTDYLIAFFSRECARA